MSGWQLTKGLQNLRAQANARWPNRDHASDGTIGDAAHQAETSGHNPDDTVGSRPAWGGDADTDPEVRAFDMDSDLREPGTSAQMLVDHLRSLPGLSSVIRYMIYDHKMYHSRDGFAPTAYTGASGHEEHIHFEGAWSQYADNNTTFDFKFGEVGEMALSKDDADVLLNRLAERLRSQSKLVAPTDDLVVQMRAVVWQYQGGGLGGAPSALMALGQVVAQVGALVKATPLDDDDKAELQAAIEAAGVRTAQDVLAGLVQAGRSDSDVASALRAALGDRAPVIGALLTDG